MAGRMDNASEAEELLPWYVNGTLSEEEAAMVRRHVQDNEQAAVDIEVLRRVRDAVKSEQYGAPGELGLRRLKAAIRDDTGRAAGGGAPGRWWRPAMAAALVLIVVQGGLLVDAWRGGDGYRPAGVATERAVIQLRFEPGATEEGIRGLLNELDVEIVAGPSSVGVYRVAPVGEDRDSGRLLTRLREAEHIVRFAELE